MRLMHSMSIGQYLGSKIGHYDDHHNRSTGYSLYIDCCGRSVCIPRQIPWPVGFRDIFTGVGWSLYTSGLFARLRACYDLFRASPEPCCRTNFYRGRCKAVASTHPDALMFSPGGEHAITVYRPNPVS